jgi:hypothetical protein
VSEAALRAAIKDFVRSIGIAIRAADLSHGSFLPGLDIASGAVLLDETRWNHPGDLLHEAGHVAVASQEERRLERLSPTPADEMSAIGWSYAAAVHLGVPLEVIFHPEGYKGGSQALIDAFNGGGTIGMPMLAYYGMTVDPRRATPDGPSPYPHMLRWLR